MNQLDKKKKKKNQNKNGNTKDNGEEKISDFFYFFPFQVYSREYRTLKPEPIDKEKYEPKGDFMKTRSRIHKFKSKRWSVTARIGDCLKLAE